MFSSSIYIAQKPIYYGAYNINVFEGTKIVITNQIYDNCAPNYLRIHCIAHRTNLVMQTSSS
jgi:hypothetical protein